MKHATHLRSLACLLLIATTAAAAPPAAPDAKAADKKGDGGYDKKAFDQAHNNALDPRAIAHAVKLGAAGDNANAFLFLLRCGPFFVKDDEGNLNENADRDAFAAAVTSSLLGQPALT